MQKRREELQAKGVKGDALRASAGPGVARRPTCDDNSLNDGGIADRAIAALNAGQGQAVLPRRRVRQAAPAVRRAEEVLGPVPAGRADQAARRTATPPKGAPELAFTDFGELRSYHDMPKDAEPVSDEQARELIHGYYAAISYMDAQVGRVLAELDELGLRDNTIVVLWGDHGWHLGEQGMWCKHTNYENATRAALMISVPAARQAAARRPTRWSSSWTSTRRSCELAGLRTAARARRARASRRCSTTRRGRGRRPRSASTRGRAAR